MQLVADGKNAAELSGELGKSTIGKSDGLGATTTNGVKSSSDSRWFRKTAKLDQGELPINHKLPRPSWTERLGKSLFSLLPKSILISILIHRYDDLSKIIIA
jgi:hypothetical protein